jgi:hypothetical protein
MKNKKLFSDNFQARYFYVTKLIMEQLRAMPNVPEKNNINKYILIKNSIYQFTQVVLGNIIDEINFTEQPTYIELENILNNKNKMIAYDIKKSYFILTELLNKKYNYQWHWEFRAIDNKVILSYQNFKPDQDTLLPVFCVKNQKEFIRYEIIFYSEKRKLIHKELRGEKANKLKLIKAGSIKNLNKSLGRKHQYLFKIIQAISPLAKTIEIKEFNDLLLTFSYRYKFFENEIAKQKLTSEEKLYFRLFPFPENETREILNYFAKQGNFPGLDIYKDPLSALLGSPTSHNRFVINELLAGPGEYEWFSHILNLKENHIVFSYDDTNGFSKSSGTLFFRKLPDDEIRLIGKMRAQ